MATPADQRLLDLLDKWLGSLELHLKYTALDDDSYWKIQSWVPHQRPTRWIVDLALQKTLALRAQVQERVTMGDAKFSDALEMMAFLANLVGMQHIERFIPRADLRGDPDEAPTLELQVAAGTDAQTGADAQTGTMEMPQFPPQMLHEPPAAGTPRVARSERKPRKPHARVRGAPKSASPESSRESSPAPAPTPEAAPADPVPAPVAAREQVIADAARLVHWGREWHELPELIARMADRPPLPEVRRILQENKVAIDEKAARL